MRKVTKEEEQEIEMIYTKLLEEFTELRGETNREELAKILDYHPSTAMRIEKGTYRLTFKLFLKLCKIYDRDPLLLLQKSILTAKK